MASKILKFSSHSNGRSVHSLCHPGRVLANSKSILPLEPSNRLESRRPFFSWFTTSSNNNNSSVASPQLPSSPCMMLPPVVNKATREKVFRFFNPVDKKVLKIKQNSNSLLPYHARCFWSCHNWLAFINPRDCALYLWNPFSSPSEEDIIQLPSIQTFPSVSGLIHGFDNHSVKNIILKNKSDTYSFRISPKYLSEYLIEKLAFSSAPSPSSDNNNCIVMAIEGEELCRLAYCKPGGEKWTVLDSPLRPYYQICYSKKMQQFYAMSEEDDIEAWDLNDLSSIKKTVIVKDAETCYASWLNDYEIELREGLCGRKNYIVESLSGDLLFVRMYYAYCDTKRGSIFRDEFKLRGKLPYKTLRIDVQKLNPSTGKWENIKCLGEQALFVGLNQPFALRAADFPGLKPNSIYFTDDCLHLQQSNYCYGGDNLGVYNMRSNRAEQFLPFGRLKMIYRPPVWVAPPHAI